MTSKQGGEPMNRRRKIKYVHEGRYVAEVDVELIEDDTQWSPYLSIDDAYKLDDVREACVPATSMLRPSMPGSTSSVRSLTNKAHN